jgi:hypothetical protein
VRVTPDSIRAREIIQEERDRVARHNANADHWNNLNKSLGGTKNIMTYTTNRFEKPKPKPKPLKFKWRK